MKASLQLLNLDQTIQWFSQMIDIVRRDDVVLCASVKILEKSVTALYSKSLRGTPARCCLRLVVCTLPPAAWELRAAHSVFTMRLVCCGLQPERCDLCGRGLLAAACVLRPLRHVLCGLSAADSATCCWGQCGMRAAACALRQINSSWRIFVTIPNYSMTQWVRTIIVKKIPKTYIKHAIAPSHFHKHTKNTLLTKNIALFWLGTSNFIMSIRVSKIKMFSFTSKREAGGERSSRKDSVVSRRTRRKSM